MQKELIDKANEIARLIEINEKDVETLTRYAQDGTRFYVDWEDYHSFRFPQSIDFEDWEIRLMIHNKRQRIKALKVELERL